MKEKKVRERRHRTIGNQNVPGYLFIAPFIIGFSCFTIIPMLMSLYYSFTQYDIYNPPQWIGVQNYITMFTSDPLFKKVFGVTFRYVIFAVPLRLAMALMIAMLLLRNTKLSGFYRAAYYLPSVIGASVAVALLWRRMWSKDGVVNLLMQAVGINSTVPWLGQESTAIWTLIILAVWQFGSSMLIFLSGLKQIPVALYESATIDGANGPQRFFKITLPMLTPTIFFNLINQLISGFMAFTQSYIITQGKPRNSTLFYAYYMYQNSFQFSKMGYGCALAWIMVLFVGLLTFVLFRTQKLWVYYETE